MDEEYYPGSKIPWHEMRPIMVAHPCDRKGYQETKAWMQKASKKLAESHAENARLKNAGNGPDMWCKSCGATTRVGECDCTFNDTPEMQDLVPLKEHWNTIVAENARLREALTYYAKMPRNLDLGADVPAPWPEHVPHISDLARAALQPEKDDDVVEVSP